MKFTRFAPSTLPLLALVLLSGCAASTQDTASVDTGAPSAQSNVPQTQLDELMESQLPDPADESTITSGCEIPVFIEQHAEEMRLLMPAYEGKGYETGFYDFEESADKLGSSAASGNFRNITADYDLGVFVMAADSGMFFDYMQTYEGFASARSSAGWQVDPVDAPGFTWAGRTVDLQGQEGIEYMLFEGDRALYISFSGARGGGLSMDLSHLPNPAMSLSTAAGIRDVLCG